LLENCLAKVQPAEARNFRLGCIGQCRSESGIARDGCGRCSALLLSHHKRVLVGETSIHKMYLLAWPRPQQLWCTKEVGRLECQTVEYVTFGFFQAISLSILMAHP